MPTIYPPGRRRKNKKWIARGRVNGAEYEVTTNARNKSEAKRAWQIFAAAIAENGCDDDPGEWTFRAALTHYKAVAERSPQQIGFIERLINCHIDIADSSMPLANAPLAAIRPGAVRKLVKAAYPTVANTTRNRQGISPIRAVINCSAEDDHCPFIKIKPFPEIIRAKRRPAAAVENLLLKNTDGEKLIYLTIIFRQGFRISETLGINWEDGIDLQRRIFILYVGKARTEKLIPMHENVFDLLANVPAENRHGKLFPWANRSSVGGWLTKLTDRLGIEFTSHMARHEWASARNEDGFTAPDMVGAGSWTDARSLKDYTDINLDHAREVIQRTRQK